MSSGRQRGSAGGLLSSRPEEGLCGLVGTANGAIVGLCSLPGDGPVEAKSEEQGVQGVALLS